MTLKSDRFAGQTINVLGKNIEFDDNGIAKAEKEHEELLAHSAHIELVSEKKKEAPKKVERKEEAKPEPDKKAPAKNTTKKTTKKVEAKED